MLRKLVTTFAASIIVFSGMTMAATPAEASLPQSHKTARMVEVAKAQKGDWYQYGAAGPSRFDCSGLVYYAYKRAGATTVPRTSRAQAYRSTRVRYPKRGDLVFFYSGANSKSNVYHVGIYLGNRMMLHSPKPGGRVRVERIWTSKRFYGRIVPRR